MSRAIYEDAVTLAREYRVAGELEVAWACAMHKLPRSYRADFLASRRGSVVGVVEVKCRTHAHGDFPDLMLSAGKFQAARALADLCVVPLVIAVEFTDGIRCATYRLTEPAPSVGWGGRTVQTRDTADIEPVVRIPADRFRPLVKVKR